jgi:triacylglycerol lipase
MRLLSLLVLAALGCQAAPDRCPHLEAALATCDLRPESEACGDLSAQEIDDVVSAIDEGGCAALRDSPGGPIDPRLCDALGWPCPAPLGAVAPGAPTRFPVLFVSGIDDQPLFDWSPDLLDRVASITGSQVVQVTLPGWQTTPVRAAALWERVQEFDRVNLVCWAVGGLDCRYLVSPGGLFPAGSDVVTRIASVTTIATPHRGTNVADALLALPPGEWTRWISAALAVEGGGSQAEREARVREVLRGLTLERAATSVLADPPDVFLQSWAGVSEPFGIDLPDLAAIDRACVDADGRVAYQHGEDDRMTDLLWPVAPFAAVAESAGVRRFDPADGLVAVSSARHGLFRGCLPADHYDLVGRLADLGPDPVTGFDAARFHAALLVDLAERGL